MRSARLFLLSLSVAPTLAAQYASCDDPLFSASTRQACQTAVDAARAFQPLAGMVISGGNALLGASGSLGGLGHFAIGTRVNAIGASLPDPNNTSGTITSAYNGLIPAPLVEGGIGVWDRVDIVGSALLMPTGLVSGLSVKSSAHVGGIALGLGFGARVVVLRPRTPYPAVSVSVMRRWMPKLGYAGDTTQANNYQFSATLRADNYRIEAGWHLGMFDVGAGLGFDHYQSDIHASGTVGGFGFGNFDTGTFAVSGTRAVVFLNGSARLGGLQLGGELGYQGGKNQTFNTNFADFDPTAGHLFAGLGLRFGR